MNYLPVIFASAATVAWIFTLAAWGSRRDECKRLGRQLTDAKASLDAARDAQFAALKEVGELKRELAQGVRVSSKCVAKVRKNRSGTYFWQIDFDGKVRATSSHKTFKTPAEPRILLESIFPGIKVKVEA